MRLYPLNIKMSGRRCVVIGGGTVAARKVGSLLECGAEVTVISPKLCAELEHSERDAEIDTARRGYQTGDLDGAFFAIAATSAQEVNEAVAHEARATGVLVNVVDVPELCDFYLPATVRRGHLLIAVSTDGVFPGLSKTLRLELEETFGPEYADYLALIGEYRERLKGLGSPETKKEAERVLLELRVLPLLANGKHAEAEAVVAQAMAPFFDKDQA